VNLRSPKKVKEASISVRKPKPDDEAGTRMEDKGPEISAWTIHNWT